MQHAAAWVVSNVRRANVGSLCMLPCSLPWADSIDRLETAQRRVVALGNPVPEQSWDRLRHVCAAAAARAGAPRHCELCSATGTRTFGHLTQLRSLTVQVRGMRWVALRVGQHDSQSGLKEVMTSHCCLCDFMLAGSISGIALGQDRAQPSELCKPQHFDARRHWLSYVVSVDSGTMQVTNQTEQLMMGTAALGAFLHLTHLAVEWVGSSPGMTCWALPPSLRSFHVRVRCSFEGLS